MKTGRSPSLTNFIVSALLTGGFVKHTHSQGCRDVVKPTLTSPLYSASWFNYPHQSIHYRNRILGSRETANHVVRYVRFPCAGLTRQSEGLVRALYWQAKSIKPRKVVIVLPIFGSFTYPTETMIKTLRRYYGDECHLLQIRSDRYIIDWDGLAEVASYAELIHKADQMAEHLRIAVIDLKRCVDWACERAEIDSGRIGIMGFSVSAVLAALTLGVDSRIKAAILVMAGARPADIIASCDGKPGIAKTAITQRLSMTTEEYHRVFEESAYHVDPVRFTGCYQPERILMFDALYDTCMPTRSRQALWQAMGQPERYTMHYGHKSSFMGMTPLGRNFIRKQAMQFLDRTL